MKNKATKDDLLTKPIIICLIAAICCLYWGSAFPTIKIGYGLFNIASNDFATQILFAGIRFTFAGILAILIGSLLAKKILIPQKESLKNIVKLSTTQTIGQYICFYIGLANTSGVKASIMESANVFLAIIIPIIILKDEKFSMSKILGCVIGFAGVILINLGSGSIQGEFKIYGEGLILLSDLFYALSAIMVKKYSSKENPVILSGYQFIVGGVILVLIGLILGGSITTCSIKGILVLCHLCIISSVAYSLWSILLKYNPVSKVSVFGFLNPIFGVFLSSILLSDKSAFTFTAILSLILVCIGIYLVNTEKTFKKDNQI